MSSSPPFAGDGTLRAALAPDVHVRAFDGEMILLNARGGEYYALNDVGQDLVQALERGYSLEECARRLHEQYEVEWLTMCSDILELARELLSRKLIVLRTERPAALEASS